MQYEIHIHMLCNTTSIRYTNCRYICYNIENMRVCAYSYILLFYKIIEIYFLLSQISSLRFHLHISTCSCAISYEHILNTIIYTLMAVTENILFLFSRKSLKKSIFLVAICFNTTQHKTWSCNLMTFEIVEIIFIEFC